MLLLNRVLTVQPGKPGSHRGKGWEEVTDQAIRALAARKTGQKTTPLVAILWGRDARTLVPLLAPASDTSIGIIESAHPSLYSAQSGFFGSIRSAGPIGSWNSKAPSRSTGNCRSRGTCE